MTGWAPRGRDRVHQQSQWSERGSGAPRSVKTKGNKHKHVTAASQNTNGVKLDFVYQVEKQWRLRSGYVSTNMERE